MYHGYSPQYVRRNLEHSRDVRNTNLNCSLYVFLHSHMNAALYELQYSLYTIYRHPSPFWRTQCFESSHHCFHEQQWYYHFNSENSFAMNDSLTDEAFCFDDNDEQKPSALHGCIEIWNNFFTKLICYRICMALPLDIIFFTKYRHRLFLGNIISFYWTRLHFLPSKFRYEERPKPPLSYRECAKSTCRKAFFFTSTWEIAYLMCLW